MELKAVSIRHCLLFYKQVFSNNMYTISRNKYFKIFPLKNYSRILFDLQKKKALFTATLKLHFFLLVSNGKVVISFVLSHLTYQIAKHTSPGYDALG